jgi:hypothetical protein
MICYAKPANEKSKIAAALEKFYRSILRKVDLPHLELGAHGRVAAIGLLNLNAVKLGEDTAIKWLNYYPMRYSNLIGS